MFHEELGQAITQNWIALILIFPLMGFLINGIAALFLSQKYPRSASNLVSCLVIALSLLVTAYGFWSLNRVSPEAYFSQKVFTWISVGDFSVSFGLQFDHLSAIMCIVVTLVGLLIHIYATGYMAHDPGYARFFTYMNLFMFMMLILVLADNLLLMFVGWEGVGLCSYLLIGFWYEDWDKAKAGLKAFIVNRVGDFGFLLGIFTLFWAIHTLEFSGMRNWISENHFQFAGMTLFGIKVATLAGIFLFIGACGKSAQIPLYVWLPDAMAGPTPVSALIHAATMVTAGVYMIGRLSFVYVHSEVALAVVAVIGALTALYAGTIGLTQTDIKRVLAYSTVSQLGYMFLAMGSMAFAAGIFHLFTHAFFKALLFLSAGSVIVAFHHKEQDIMKMGGLSKYLPWTFRTVFIAFLAIIGIPPFAGFWSKDEILFKAFATSNQVLVKYHLSFFLWLIGLTGALLTAVYMTRWMILTFWGTSRVDEETKHHLKESPNSMLIPLGLLALGSAFVGFLGVPEFFGGHNWFEKFLEPSFAKALPGPELSLFGRGEYVEAILVVMSVAMAGLGILLAYAVYLRKPGMADELAQRYRAFYHLSFNKYYVDEIYDRLIVSPLIRISYYFLFRFFDMGVIDGVIINGTAKLNQWLGKVLRRLQNGVVQTYLFFFVSGLLIIILFLGAIHPAHLALNKGYGATIIYILKTLWENLI